MPVLGLGVFQTEPGPTTRHAVAWALAAGYRLIDTAALYGNEADVGAAVRESGIPREEIFVTTKLWHTEHGRDRARRAFAASRERLGLDYVDLYLIHWPRAETPEARLASWEALEEIHAEGLARAVGVSNYAIRHLEEIVHRSHLVPAVNQVEFHPFLYDPTVLRYAAEHGIRVQAYSPLTRNRRLDDPRIAAIAEEVGRTPAQVLVRWGLEHGVVEIPKSTHRERIEENARVFDFALSGAQRAALDALADRRRVTQWNPEEIP
ncbi:MAG TPA: aldo/keto reductase [Thermoplasmata archaeon]|nr:aldo/keto reductase [Thermoplasmata archaeon]